MSNVKIIRLITKRLSQTLFMTLFPPSQTFSPPDATLCDKFIQHYVIRGDTSPHFRRLTAVNDRFCGDNLIGI